MCGICGIVSTRGNIVKELYNGILNLEYRGYDSCGLGVLNSSRIVVRKNVGCVPEVNAREGLDRLNSSVGIAHTRWATHGKVSKINAHPQLSFDKSFAIVHNGVINNHLSLKKEIEARGVRFESETDTEVFANLLALYYSDTNSLEEALLKATQRVEGYFAVIFISTHDKSRILGVRKGSPLMLGVGSERMFVASDSSAFLPYTREAVAIEDGEWLSISPKGYTLRKIKSQKKLRRNPFQIEWSIETSRKDGYAHYMLKEIFEQPSTIKSAMNIEQQSIAQLATMIEEARQTYLIGIGTTYYVAIVGQYLFSQLAGTYIPAISSDEFPHLAFAGSGDLVVAISQSGETFDTRQSIELAHKNNSKVASIINVMGSSISMRSDFVIYQGSGPEISVVSTKSALAQMIILLRTAILVGEHNGHLKQNTAKKILKVLDNGFPNKVQDALNELSGQVRNFARKTSVFNKWFFLGRGIYHPIALEAALKMKEITYYLVEGMGTGFLKHGTLAVVDKNIACLFFVPHPKLRELNKVTLSSISEVKARGGPCFGIVFQEDTQAQELLDEVITIPDCIPELAPFLQLVIAQLFAYFSANALGHSIDRPRNLAKSVTVE